MQGARAIERPRTPFAVPLLAVILLTATVAPASTRAADRKHPRTSPAAQQTWQAPSGRFSLRLRTDGHRLRTRAHAKAAPQQLQESLEVLLEGNVLLRVEGYANPQRQTARTWLKRLAPPLRAGKITRLRRLPRGATGVQIRMARSPQSYAQDVLLIAAKGVRIRLVCPDRDDKRARALLRAALRGLSLARHR